MSNKAKHWYALRVLTRQEDETSERLRGAGMAVYVPLFRTLTKPTKKRKPVEVQRPLLPGYVLAQVPATAWYGLRDIKGVVGWIEGADGPTPILRSKQVTDMMERERLGQFDHDGLEGRLQKGDPLEVLFGPFAGWRVSFSGVKGDRIEGEVDILGAKRKVRVQTQHVRLAK